MSILDRIKGIFNLNRVDKRVSYKTRLIGLGDMGSSIVERIKNQDIGIKDCCSGDQQSPYEIDKMLMDTDLALLVCGFDAEVCMDKIESIALRAKKLGTLTLGIIMTPLESEGEDQIKAVRKVITNIKEIADALVVIPKERVRYIPGNGNLNSDELGIKTEEVLQFICENIIRMICNLEEDDTDLEDISRVISSKGIMYFGVGQAEGENKASLAITQVMNNSLVEGTLSRASNLILSISGSFSRTDFKDIYEILEKEISQNAHILCNLHVDKTAGDIISVTVLAAA